MKPTFVSATPNRPRPTRLARATRFPAPPETKAKGAQPGRPPVAFAAPQLLPQGDGSFLVKPGRPVSRLTTAQFGAQLGVSASTVRRYIEEGIVPAEFVECAGKRKWLVDAAALAVVQAHFKQTRLA